MIDLEAHKKAEDEAMPGPWLPYEGPLSTGATLRHGPTRERVVFSYDSADALCLMRNNHAEMIRELEELRSVCSSVLSDLGKRCLATHFRRSVVADLQAGSHVLARTLTVSSSPAFSSIAIMVLSLASRFPLRRYSYTFSCAPMSQHHAYIFRSRRSRSSSSASAMANWMSCQFTSAPSPTRPRSPPQALTRSRSLARSGRRRGM